MADYNSAIKEHYHSMKWYQKISFNLLWGLCRMLNYSPRWFRFYVLRPLFTAILYVVGYRRKVIIRNLERSFPEKSKAEIRKIMRRFYVTLAEIIVNTVCLAGATQKRDGDVITWEDAPGHIAKNRGRDWIAMASHYGCWEYFPLWSWADEECEFMSVYHPLRSVVFEHFYRRLRKFAPNAHNVTMAETVRYYIKNRASGRTTVLGLISDQSPNLRADTVWFNFLNQTTAFIDGSEKIAMRFGIPVYFCDIERRAAGRYHVRFIQIYDGVEQVEPNEITRRYAEHLERMIRRAPELWMWSHNRWKHTPEKQAKKFGKSTFQ